MTNSIILKIKTKNITRFLTNLYKLRGEDNISSGIWEKTWQKDFI